MSNISEIAYKIFVHGLGQDRPENTANAANRGRYLGGGYRRAYRGFTSDVLAPHTTVSRGRPDPGSIRHTRPQEGRLPSYGLCPCKTELAGTCELGDVFPSNPAIFGSPGVLRADGQCGFSATNCR